MDVIVNCDLRLNGSCKGEKYHGQVCGRLRPLICNVRKKLDQEKARKKKLIGRADKPLGIGA